jgi:hypothetical protein
MSNAINGGYYISNNGDEQQDMPPPALREYSDLSESLASYGASEESKSGRLHS